MSTATVKMSLHLSERANDMLEQMCEDNDVSKSELMRRALALMSVATKYKKKGGHLVVLDDNGNQLSEIIGL